MIVFGFVYQLNTLGVTQYIMQLHTDKCIPKSERIVCVTVCYHPVTRAVTHCLWRIYLRFGGWLLLSKELTMGEDSPHKIM